MVVIGGYNSSNTQALARMCAPRVTTYYIDSPQCVERRRASAIARSARTRKRWPPGWLPAGDVRIGITAGASTPDSVVGETIERILALRGRTAGDLTQPADIEQGSSTFAKARGGQAELRMIGTRPTELTLTLAPQRRFEAIDVNRRIAEEFGDLLRRHRRALYTSFHTTAGYLDQSLSVRLNHQHDLVSQFFRAFHALFPQGGEYRHDQMHLRSELTDEQKVVEPRNGDSHLTFIGAGMRNCVTYRTRPDSPVYFIELDGKTDALQRQRKTTVVAYDHDEIVARDVDHDPGVEAPDRFDQPRRSEARPARARQRDRRPRRRRARPRRPGRRSEPSATSA